MKNVTEMGEVRLEERFRDALSALEALGRRGGPLALVARAVNEAETLRLMLEAHRSTFGELVGRAERTVNELRLVAGDAPPLERVVEDIELSNLDLFGDISVVAQVKEATGEALRAGRSAVRGGVTAILTILRQKR